MSVTSWRRQFIYKKYKVTMGVTSVTWTPNSVNVHCFTWLFEDDTFSAANRLIGSLPCILTLT